MRREEEVKQITLRDLQDYLNSVDAHENPKTIKVVEVHGKRDIPHLTAVTFPMTFLIKWEWNYEDGDVGKAQFKVDLETLKAHGHVEGYMRDITTGPRL